MTIASLTEPWLTSSWLEVKKFLENWNEELL